MIANWTNDDEQRALLTVEITGDGATMLGIQDDNTVLSIKLSDLNRRDLIRHLTFYDREVLIAESAEPQD